MHISEIAGIRLSSQKISSTSFSSAKEIVTWMGAMQAQDYSMAKWAIGSRILDPTNESIENAFNQGEIIRTHLLRPTWHFVSAEDVYWILELTAPHIKPLMKSRDLQLGLTESVFTKSKLLIEKALSIANFMNRDELAKVLNMAGIETDNNRLSHILVHAELDKLVCSGPIQNKKQTFALFDERVKYKKILSREESIAELASRYFTSHCPATLYDFVWWSGLSVSDARKGIENIKNSFVSETIENGVYWFPNSFSMSETDKESVFLLPAYDEYLIAYKDRSASLLKLDNKNVISSNGIFYPVVVENGMITGKWKKLSKKEQIYVEIELFNQVSQSVKKQLKLKAKTYSHFLNKELIVSY